MTTFFSALGSSDTNCDRVNTSTAGNISILFYDGNYRTTDPSAVGNYTHYYRLRSDYDILYVKVINLSGSLCVLYQNKISCFYTYYC